METLLVDSKISLVVSLVVEVVADRANMPRQGADLQYVMDLVAFEEAIFGKEETIRTIVAMNVKLVMVLVQNLEHIYNMF